MINSLSFFLKLSSSIDSKFNLKSSFTTRKHSNGKSYYLLFWSRNIFLAKVTFKTSTYLLKIQSVIVCS